MNREELKAAFREIASSSPEMRLQFVIVDGKLFWGVAGGNGADQLRLLRLAEAAGRLLGAAETATAPVAADLWIGRVLTSRYRVTGERAEDDDGEWPDPNRGVLKNPACVMAYLCDEVPMESSVASSTKLDDASRLRVALGGSGEKILSILNRQAAADDKYNELCRIDPSYAGWSDAELGELLGCTRQNIAKGPHRRADKARHREPD